MSLAFIKQIDPTTRVGLWKVNESIADLEQKLILNQEERDFFNSLNKNKRNLHWLGSRVLLRSMIDTPEFIELRNDENGKPYLVNFDFEISISHSFEYAAAIISDKSSGIDIELMRPKIQVIKNRFMSPEELEEAGDDAVDKKLFIYWCAKEALFKLYGKKPLSMRQNIYISPFEAEQQGSVYGSFKNIKDFPESFFRLYYEEHNGYMMVYVWE